MCRVAGVSVSISEELYSLSKFLSNGNLMYGTFVESIVLFFLEIVKFLKKMTKEVVQYIFIIRETEINLSFLSRIRFYYQNEGMNKLFN